MEEKIKDSEDAKLATKYRFIREKILTNYKKGKHIYRSIKIAVAILFVIFTIFALIISKKTGNVMLWLVLWIAQIFINVTIFLFGDYLMYSFEDRFIPYINDDDRMEYGINLFDNDDDDDEEKEDDEEEDD